MNGPLSPELLRKTNAFWLAANYLNITEDEIGMKKLLEQFSILGGIAGHVAPETPDRTFESGG
jgi:phosphoketolase